MPWYGHTVELKINDNAKFPKYKGKLSFLNGIASTETNRLSRKMRFMGTQIVNEIAHRSQVHQRNTITELGAVDTGRLRDSVRITGSALRASIGTDLYYAEQVHDIGYRNQKIFNINGLVIRGHSDIGPRPWVDRSADRLVSDIDEIVTANIDKII